MFTSEIILEITGKSDEMKTLWTALFTILSQLFLASGFIAIAQGNNSKFISGSLFWTFKAFISIEVYNLYNISYNITNFEFIIGPKYVLLYGVLLSGIIGLIRQFSSIQSLGTSIIKLCATQEQQERCLGSLSIDSNSLKQKTE